MKNNKIGVFKILRNIKNIFVHVRSSLKFIFLIIISTVLIAGIISLVYRPMYSVTLNGEFIGYTKNKSKLQKRINEYIENGENKENIAFIDVASLPEYSLCLLKRDNQTNDDEIFDTIKNSGTTYYKYYAIVEDNKEKYYVSTKEEAESIINKLKEKKSRNIDDIAYTQIHSTELKEFKDVEAIVTALYEKPKVVVASSGYSTYNGARIVNGSAPSAQVLGIGLVKPVSGTISSRFGARASGNHKGLDIAAPTGRTIAAAATGTVTFSGWDSYGLGYCVKISHGNGVDTVYGHCSKLYVTKGQKVSAGEAIAAVGSTGNSTGSHLHLEIRVNGVPQNPQLYLYK